MPTLKGTKTEKNLLTAFAGESQARNRYTYFSKQAVNDGYMQVSRVFEETANQESQHAKRFFKFLEGGDVQITASFPAGMIGTTLENLKAAAAGEKHEYSEMYPSFAAEARKEGFNDVAAAFDAISKAEAFHERRYSKLAQNIEKELVYKKEKSATWVCDKCGYNHEGLSAPNKCPACHHAQAYFYALNDTF